MESLIRENIEKRTSKIKWIDREYHVHDNDDVANRYVKMYCNTNQLPTLPLYGPHPKPRGASGLSNHYHLRFDTKLCHGNSKFSEKIIIMWWFKIRGNVITYLT